MIYLWHKCLRVSESLNFFDFLSCGWADGLNFFSVEGEDGGMCV